MLKLILSVTVLWTFFCKAAALDCLSCSGSCSTETTDTCSTETMCVTATITETSVFSADTTKIHKGCASSDLCPITGSQTYELNLGVSGALISAECCNFDGCNNNTLPAHTQSQTLNGLHCFFCGFGRCDVSFDCKGDETLCIQGTLNEEIRGCVSPSVCTASRRLGELPLLPDLGTFSSGPNCCDTDECNDGTTTTPPPTTTPERLRCQSCNGSCSTETTVTCSTETMCVTATITDTASGSSDTRFYKACASSDLCPMTGSQTYELDLVVSGALISAECCDTNGCNNNTLPAHTQSQTLNGLRCLFCAFGRCDLSLACMGDETLCIQGTLNDEAYGCASPSVCTASRRLGEIPLLPELGTFSSGPNCSHTDVCSDGTTTTPPTTTTTPPTTTTTPPTTTTTPPTTDPRLQCLSCNDSSCSSPESVTCSSETMCITASIKDVSSGDESFFRGCAPPTLCPNNGTFNFSTDVFDSHKIIDAECCDTNNCNSETLPVPVQQETNGLECYVCLFFSGSNVCTAFTVQCKGAQDRCFIGSASTDNGVLLVAGCTSTDVCDIAPDHGVLPFMEEVGNLTSGLTCCGTNRCNVVA